MTMQSPEILLKELNHALRCLRGACTVLDDTDIDHQLLAVMQRLLLAELLGNTWVVAVGGSQGAGKTTLMASLYDIDGDGPQWLQGNEGRGEKLPVLITEDADCSQPQGYVRRLVPDAAGNGFEIKPVEVDIAEFQRSVCDPQAEDLLPELRMPRRYFLRDNQAWLLLPGYEKQDRENRTWQQLMRQAMVAAGGCIIVTDQNRMANRQQLEIVQDMLASELRGCQPYIVISKTEAHRKNPQRLAALRASAQETYQVQPELADKHIILSGADDPEYVKEWMPYLRSAIDSLNFTGQSNRHLQMSQLSQLLGQDLTQVLNAIRSKSRLYFNRHTSDDVDGQQVLEEILDAFDDAAEALRIEHQEKIRNLARQALANASAVLNQRLIQEQEGFRNWLSTAFDTTSETSIKMQTLVQQAWRQGAPNFFADYAYSLLDLTLGRLGASRENAGARQLPKDKAQSLIQLGYANDNGQPVRFNAINPETASNIRILLGNGSPAEERDNHHNANKQFQGSVELIPTLSLEYTRLLYNRPQVIGLKADLSPAEASSDRNVVADGVENLQASVILGKTAIRSLASVMAVDVLSDGDSDILGALFGNTQAADQVTDTGSSVPAAAMPLTLHPVAIAATAVAAAGYLTAKAVTGLRNTEKQASAQAHSMLINVHDHHIAHLQKQFDDTMRAARTRIKQKIRDRYRMNEALMQKDRLAKAMADVKAITSDLRHELDASATGLQLFITERNN